MKFLEEKAIPIVKIYKEEYIKIKDKQKRNGKIQISKI